LRLHKGEYFFFVQKCFYASIFSSNNAKKWQDDAEILRNNNAKLTTALQESHANVEEWKRQLQFYRDECSRLRQIVKKFSRKASLFKGRPRNL
jgi:hypothetical protein